MTLSATHPSGLRILTLLSDIENGQCTKAVAREALRQSGLYDWLFIAAIDTACTLHLNNCVFFFLAESIEIRNAGVTVNVASADADLSSDNTIIYGEFGKAFEVTGITEPLHLTSKDPVELLFLISHLTFHVDGIMLLPHALRIKRITSIATSFNVESSFVISMLKNIGSISERSRSL